MRCCHKTIFMLGELELFGSLRVQAAMYKYAGNENWKDPEMNHPLRFPLREMLGSFNQHLRRLQLFVSSTPRPKGPSF